MWSDSIMKKMYDCLQSNGFLVTYCAQGQFKRDLKKVGFKEEGLFQDFYLDYKGTRGNATSLALLSKDYINNKL